MFKKVDFDPCQINSYKVTRLDKYIQIKLVLVKSSLLKISN